MKQKRKTNTAIINAIAETDLKREMENTIEANKATIVMLSLEVSELKEKYKKQSQRLGGFVQSNKNYKGKVERQNALLEDLIKKVNRFSLENSNQGNSITSLRKHYELACKEIDGLKVDVKSAEDNYNIQYNLNIEYGKQLASIRSKWWFWLFNW